MINDAQPGISATDSGSTVSWWRRFANRIDRWSLRSVPEHQLFETEAARIKAIAELDSELSGDRSFGRVMTAIIVAGVLLANGSFCIVPMVLPWKVGSWSWVIVLVIVLSTTGAVIWLWRRSVAKRLRGKLIESGVPVCRACGYPLRGLSASSTTKCPECGWAADEAVRGLMSG